MTQYHSATRSVFVASEPTQVFSTLSSFEQDVAYASLDKGAKRERSLLLVIAVGLVGVVFTAVAGLAQGTMPGFFAFFLGPFVLVVGACIAWPRIGDWKRYERAFTAVRAVPRASGTTADSVNAQAVQKLVPKIRRTLNTFGTERMIKALDDFDGQPRTVSEAAIQHEYDRGQWLGNLALFCVIPAMLVQCVLSVLGWVHMAIVWALLGLGALVAIYAVHVLRRLNLLALLVFTRVSQ